MKRRTMSVPVPAGENTPQASARPVLTEEAVEAFLNGRDPAEAFHDGDGFGEMRRKVAERALNPELDHHLSRSRDGNTRNGRNRKTVHTERGSLPLDLPRDRRGTFRPQLVEPWCRRLEGFDNLVLSLFSAGRSRRCIRDPIAG